MQENKSLPLMVAVTMMIAAITATWAIATESHNYRLANFTSRLKAHEDGIMTNTRSIDKIITASDSWQRDIEEIKGDVKELLKKSD